MNEQTNGRAGRGSLDWIGLFGLGSIELAVSQGRLSNLTRRLFFFLVFLVYRGFCRAYLP